MEPQNKIGIVPKSSKERVAESVKSLGEWREIEMSPLEYLKTGTDFDKANGGLLKGGLTVVVGASGDGKSMTTLHLASILSNNYTVLYVSAENDIRLDMERFKEAEKIYGINQDNIFYINTLYSEISNLDIKKDMYSLITELAECVDIIVLDAWQNTVNPDEGGKMYSEGNDICFKLCKLANKFNTVVLMSWQLKNGNKSKTIENITIDDISVSVGIARYATAVWCVKRTFPFEKDGKTCRGTWKMSLLKSRVNIDTRYTLLNVQNEEDKFSLYGKNVINNDQAENLIKSLLPHKNNLQK